MILTILVKDFDTCNHAFNYFPTYLRVEKTPEIFAYLASPIMPWGVT